jgi:hypothetical protein
MKIQQNMMELYKNQNAETTQIEEAIELMKKNSIEIDNEMTNKVFNLKYFQNDQEIDFDSIVGGILKVEKYEK